VHKRRPGSPASTEHRLAFPQTTAHRCDGNDPASFVGLTAVGVVLVLGGALLFERRNACMSSGLSGQQCLQQTTAA
jgi:hypothetical protein